MDLTGFGSIAKLIDDGVNKIWPDKTEAQKQEFQLLQQQLTQEYATVLAQIDVNKEEAKSTNWFVAGWRPAIGWICGATLAYSALFEPIARFVANVGFGYKGEFPVIDTTLTGEILVGMLGLGSIRSFDKLKGVDTK